MNKLKQAIKCEKGHLDSAKSSVPDRVLYCLQYATE